MTFQHPLILAGVAVLVLPVLFNLLGRATARRQAWGATMFLEDSTRSARRGISRPNLLLLMRVGLLAALVLAFARPKRSTNNAIGVQRTIVVDTGPSMGLFDAGINRLDRAKAAALKAMATLKPEDRAALVTAEVTVRPTADLQSLAARINDLSVSPDPVDVAASLRAAVAFSNGTSRRGQVCVIGDLSDVRWHQAMSTEHLPDGEKLFACNVGQGRANDLVLRDLSVSPAPSGGFVAAVQGVNTASAAQAIQLRWAIDAINGGQSNLTVPGHGTSTAIFPAFDRPVGTHVLTVSLADSIPSTAPVQSETFAVEPAPQVFVAGDAAPIVAAAMAPADVRWARELSADDLRHCNLLLLCGAPWPAPDVLNAVSRFVRAGGRLLVLPDAGTAEARIETALDRLALSPARGGPSLSATQPTRRLTRGGPPLPSSINTKWIELARGAQEVTPFQGARPIAVSMPAGRGAVMIASTGVDEEESLLAESPMLRPWLSTLVDDLCPPIHSVPPLVLGEPFVATVAAPVDLHSAVVRTPAGESEGMIVRRSADTCELRYPQTQLNGVYQVSYRSNGRPHQTFFAVEPPTRRTVGGLSRRDSVDDPSHTPEQMAEALAADRPSSFDGFGLLLSSAIGLFVLAAYTESSGSRGRW